MQRGTETFYVRIAEEAADSFAPEVEVHTRLVRSGAQVPDIVHYEPFHDGLNRSVIVTTRIVGEPPDADASPAEVAKVSRAAGQDLARVHGVSVDGFGWLLRDHDKPGWPLRGEFAPYADFVDPVGAAAPLVDIGFTVGQARHVERLLADAVSVGPGGSVDFLAHGDFDTTDMFGKSGAYTGLIDFGEIRGTDYTFDLATLWLHTDREPAATAYPHVEAGYAEIRPLPGDHAWRL